MGAQTTKTYQINIELSQAQQALDTATKSLAEFKTKAAAANTEARETKEIYQQNAAALKELTGQQKALEAAVKSAAPGATWAQATAALNKNVAAQQQLNTIVQESKVVYNDAKQAAAAAGAAVGQQAATVKELGGSVKEYAAAAKQAATEFAPGTFGAIDAEIKQLQVDLKSLVPGSAEADAAIRKMASGEAELRKMGLAVNSMSPRTQARAFTALSGALTGCVTVALAGAQAFGLSDKNAQQYAQTMQGLSSVLMSIEQINRLANQENLALVGSIWQGAKAYLGIGQAAKAAAVAEAEAGVAGTAAGGAIKTAMLSTGIGALVVLLGFVLSYLSDINSTATASQSNFTQYKSVVVGVFSGLIEVVKDYFKILWQVMTGDWLGAAETAKQAGAGIAKAYTDGRNGVIEEALRKEAELAAKHYERLLRIEQARGVDTENMERELLRKKVLATKKSSDEEKDALAELAAFNKAARKRHQEEAQALTLAHLNKLLAMEKAAGNESYQTEQEIEAKKLQFLLDAPKREAAAIEAQRGVIAAQRLAHEREEYDKRFALAQAKLQGQINLQQAMGEDAYQLQMKQLTDKLHYLKHAGIQDAAALEDANNAIKLLTYNHDQELEQKHRLALIQSNVNEIALREKAGEDTLELRVKNAELLLAADKDAGTRGHRQLANDLQRLRELLVEHNVKERAIQEGQQQQRVDYNETANEAQRKFLAGVQDNYAKIHTDTLYLTKNAPNLGLKLIRGLFGVDINASVEARKAAEELQAKITEAFSQLYQAGGQVASAFLDAATQETEQALSDAQARLQTATEQLSTLQSQLDSDTSKLESASGARRDYLLQKLAKEREEVAKVAAAKKKAADEEAKQLARQHELQKVGLELSAAQSLAANVAAAAKAVDAGVSAIAGAAAQPFPLSLPAIIAAVAAVAAAVGSAKQLASATKYESGTGALGADGVLIGPRHGQGGIQIYGRNGTHYGEAEGGEAITPVDATQKNGDLLYLLRTEGRSRTLGPLDMLRVMQGGQNLARAIKPSPASYYEPGGILNKGGTAPAGGYASAGSVASLQAEQQRTNALLAQLVGVSNVTAQNTGAAAAHAADTAASNRKLVSYGPPVLEFGHEAELKRQRLQQGMQADEAQVTL